MKKIAGIIIIFLIVGAVKTFGQRVKQSIDTDWSFYRGEVDLNNPPSEEKWESICLPHSWNTCDVTDDRPGYYRGVGTYRKTLFLPDSYKNKDVYLYFEGANQVAEVYVNKRFAGKHTGGYTAFSFRINDFLRFDGESNRNEIEVRVDNSHNENIPPLSADFTFFGGIYRDVYLLALNKTHFDADDDATEGIFISTPMVDSLKAAVEIRGKITNRDTGRKKLRVESSIYDEWGKRIGGALTSIKVESGRDVEFEQAVKDIHRPALWSPDHPYLYRVLSVITDERGDTLDVVGNPLGFRWYEFTADKGFFLNGRHCKLWGASRHQDYPGKANALPDEMHVKDAELLKEMGANLIRVAHYPQDPELMEACDRMGLLASVEIPIVNRITENAEFRNNCLKMMEEMIRQNYNHPSVVIWAYMNEVLGAMRYGGDKAKQEIYLHHVKQLAESIDSLSRKEDPSRYTMLPCHGDMSLYMHAGLTAIPQIVGWNFYFGWYGKDIDDFEKNVDRHHKELGDKPLIITEFGADGDPRVHSFEPVRYDKSIEYETYFHKVYRKIIDAKPFISGAMAWTFHDFNAEQRGEAMPHVNNKGLVTGERRPKDVYFYYQSQLLKKPFLAIGSREWTLRSAVADSLYPLQCTQSVEIYTNRKEEVSLFLNGRLLGKEMPEEGTAVFKVPFVNGVNRLEAEAMAGDTSLKDEADIDFKLIPFRLKDLRTPFTEINVSLGDRRYFVDEELEKVWIPEQSYVPGSWGYVGGRIFKDHTSSQPYGSGKAILSTSCGPLYETQRIGIRQFRLDVPEGKYALRLHFAELENDKNLSGKNGVKGAGGRKFDISVNGQKVIEGLGDDNYLVPRKAYDTKCFVNVRGSEGIVVNFEPIEGEPILNGLQVSKIF